MAAKGLSGGLIAAFRGSGDTLRVYHDGRLVFSSVKDRLAPLIEYIGSLAHSFQGVCILDRVVGNAAALLLIRAACREVFSETGSEHAAATLSAAGIAFRFDKTVPFILNDSADGMCPMEKLSLGKTPEEFLDCLTPASR